eukprot:TRINITY_DN45718_c0_g1_i1.p1 TRINITY_DN45718_c0_g1~~TRINITY_DN45718_c0_g1_i1.p1  ORF type:complete len:242 (-),score=21.91 TRINITY_DN45718_c0_g1_i1:204-872(-)
MARSWPARTDEEIRAACEATIADYAAVATGYAEGNLNHDVSQNIEACLRGSPPPLDILDLGCAGGRDLATFLKLGHCPTGVAGSEAFACIARKTAPGVPVQVQNIYDLDVPECSFDRVFANAVLFHLPSAGMPRVLSRIYETLRPGGVFFASNAHGFGEDREGWTDGRTPSTVSYVSWLSEDTWCGLCREAGFELLELYYRPPNKPRNQQPFLGTAWLKRAP